ncbi:MAG: hypothetical protein JWR88_2205 [Pseudonocardia sp.]|nr:hypothetical protein [Pseudonocardia sp.]
MIERIGPPYVNGERAMLTSWLEYHRATLEQKCAGVPEARLAERTVPPSSLSLLGLVRHMAEVERSWFRRVFGGQDAPPLYYSDAEPEGDFDNAEGADVGETFATWHAECEHARSAAAGATSLDVAGMQQGETVPLRWIMVHMIEEYARHNGHADLLRERIDGATGE